MMLLKGVQYFYLQSFLLILCSELANAVATSGHKNSRFLNQTSNYEDSSPTVTTVLPLNWTLPNEPSVQSSISRQFIACSCNVFQQAQILVAWYEAKNLTDAVSSGPLWTVSNIHARFMLRSNHDLTFSDVDER